MAQPADEGAVVALGVQRRRVAVVRRVVHQHEAVLRLDRLAQRRDRRLRGELDVHRGPVPDHRRHAHAGRGEGQLRLVEDLARLVAHLQLLDRVAVLGEVVDLREHVHRELVRVDLRRGQRLVAPVGAQLRPQLGDGRRSRARGRLIRGGDDAAQRGDVAHRVQRHRDRGRGAVRDRDDALVPVEVVAVHLRDHDRDVRLHAVGGAVVDHHAAVRDDHRAPAQRCLGGGGAEDDVRAGQRLFARLLHGDRLVAVAQLPAGRARRGQQAQLRQRQPALGRDAEEDVPHGAGRADHRDHRVGHWSLAPRSALVAVTDAARGRHVRS